MSGFSATISPRQSEEPLAVTAVVDPKPSDYRDTSLCAAYLSPSVMQDGGVHVDDVVRVTTQRSRSAVVRVRGEVADPGETIRFDRFTRQALKAFPHETVT